MMWTSIAFGAAIGLLIGGTGSALVFAALHVRADNLPGVATQLRLAAVELAIAVACLMWARPF